MANELDVGSIVLRIRADASAVQEGLKELERGLGQAQTATQAAGGKIEQSAKGMAKAVGDSSVAQGAFYAAMAAAAAKAMVIVVGAIDKGVTALNRYRSALIGLDSVASGRGIQSDKLQGALDQVTDAFFDAAAASTAFKNLLARGYNLEQATQSILRLKDSAAFGRQASLGLAEAVVTATEGLKNENSILVDNAGVTKNVSVMWREYATSIGTTVDKLTQAQKIEAEYQGIMRETVHQQGDLAKLQDTLAGAQAATAMGAQKLAESYGSAMAPAVELVTKLFGSLLGILRDVVQAFPALTAGVSAAALAIGLLFAAQKAAAAIKALYTAFQMAAGGATILGVSISTALPWIAAIGAVIGVVTAAFTHYSKEQEKAREADEKAAQAEQERVRGLQTAANELKALGDRYGELIGKTSRTYSENHELLEIEKKLFDQYGITGSAIDDLTGRYGTLTQAIKDKRIETLKEIQDDKIKAAEASKAAAAEALAIENAAIEYSALTRQIKAEKDKQADLFAELGGSQAWDEYLHGAGAAFEHKITELEGQQIRLMRATGINPDKLDTYVQEARTAVRQMMQDQIEVIAGQYEIGGGKINQAAKNMLDQLFLGFTEKPERGLHLDTQYMVNAYAESLTQADLGPAMAAMEGIQRDVLTGAEPKEADKAKLVKSWEMILGFAQDVGARLGMSEEGVLTFAKQLAPVMAATATSTKDASAAIESLYEQAKAQSISDFISADAEGLTKIMSDLRTNIEAETKAMATLGENLTTNTGIIAALEQLKTALSEEDPVLLAAAAKALEDLGMQAPKTAEGINQALTAQKAYREDITAQMGVQMDLLLAMQKSFQEKQAALAQQGKQDSPEYKALEAYVQMVNDAQQAMQAALDSKAPISFDLTRASASELQTELDKTTKSANALTKSLNEKTDQRAKIVEIQRVAKAQQDGTATAKELAAAQKSAADVLGYTGDSVAEMAGRADIALANLDGEIANISTQANEAMGWIAQLLSYISTSGASVNVDTSAAQNALSGLIAVWNALAAVIPGMKAVGGDQKPKSRGGGGGGGGNKNDEILREQENLRRSELAAAYAHIEHKKALGQIDVWNEIQMLEQIRYAHQLNAEELRELDEKVFEAHERLRRTNLQRDLDAISHRQAMGELSTDQEIAALERLLRVHYMTTEERWQVEEQIYAARERKRQDALNWDLALLNHSKAMGQMNLVEEILTLERIKAAHQLNAEELHQIEEQLYTAREALRRERLQTSLDLLAHEKAMGRVSVEQEIQRLEQIKRENLLTEQELRQIDERLYSLRNQAIQNQEGQVKTAYNRIVQALRKRLDEEKRLETKAIDDRISELDKLTKAENEAQRERDYQSDLAEKQRELSVSKSARRRRELEAEIAKMQEDEALRQTQATRELEKERLNQEKQAIQERYDSLMSEENLRQEALRLVMSSNLEAMTDLISSYGSQWQDAGAQLAQALSDGIIGNASGIMDAISRLESGIQTRINAQLSNIGRLPAQSSGVTVSIQGDLVVREEADVDRIAAAIMRSIEAESR